MPGWSPSNKDLGVDVEGDDVASCCNSFGDTVRW